MINLLPPATKEDVLFARRNAKLVKWVVAIIISAIGSFIIIAFGQLYLTQAASSYTQQIQEGQERLREQKLEETQAKVGEISGNLKLVVQVLSREILFSKVLRQVGAAIPSGTVLTNLTLSGVEGGISLNFEAKDYQTGSQIVLNLQDPANKIFEQADIESISCDNKVVEGRIYPCSVSIRALFGDNSPYLFINDGVKQ